MRHAFTKEPNDCHPLFSLVCAFLCRDWTRSVGPIRAANTLSLFNNQISDISPLSGLDRIEYLAIGNNRICDLEPLTSLSQLHSLFIFIFIFSNEISDLIPLQDLTELRSLSLATTHRRHLPLAHLHELEELLLFNTSVADIAPLKNLAQLTWLDLYNTPVAETTTLYYSCR